MISLRHSILSLVMPNFIYNKNRHRTVGRLLCHIEQIGKSVLKFEVDLSFSLLSAINIQDENNQCNA
ncbi:hypothetical protein PRUPE_3G214700 [Prunus persica]|uniref:Uncharacterized protein n=1 Tax=Prunus persica TaxID=3760 RepID=A0A251Q3P8_PRUPE|nr:hypothetical protein PRUPE_3G214700 [Prunus persica]